MHRIQIGDYVNVKGFGEKLMVVEKGLYDVLYCINSFGTTSEIRGEFLERWCGQGVRIIIDTSSRLHL